MKKDVLFAEIPRNLKTFVIDTAEEAGITQANFMTAMIDYVKERGLAEEIIDHWDEVVLNGEQFS